MGCYHFLRGGGGTVTNMSMIVDSNFIIPLADTKLFYDRPPDLLKLDYLMTPLPIPSFSTHQKLQNKA